MSVSFKEVQGRYNGPALEEEVLEFWREHDVFQKTIDATKDGPQFSFNEGPPTANGKPGIHHVLARSFKDIFPTLQNNARLSRAPQSRLGHTWAAG